MYSVMDVCIYIVRSFLHTDCNHEKCSMGICVQNIPCFGSLDLWI